MLTRLPALLIPLIFALALPAAAQQAPRPVIPTEGLPQAGQQAPAVRTRAPGNANAPAATATPAPAATAAPAAAAAAQQAVVPPTTAELDKIVITRVKSYRKNGAEGARAEAVSPTGSGRLFRSPGDPGMEVQFRLLPPQGWSIVSVDDAQLVRALDQAGNPLTVTPNPKPAANATESRFNMVSPAQELSERPIVSLRAQEPARGEELLQQIVATFQITLGQTVRQQYKNLRAYAGKQLPNLPVPGLTLIVEEMTNEEVVLRALGKVDHLGSLQLVGANGGEVMPYAQEEVSNINENAGQIQRTWRLSFAGLPEMVHLNMTAYPVMTTQTVQFEQAYVPLP